MRTTLSTCRLGPFWKHCYFNSYIMTHPLLYCVYWTQFNRQIQKHYMEKRTSFCFIWFWFFLLPQHFIRSWNISGSQGWAHSSTHSCAIPDNCRSPIPLLLPRFSERSERQAVQTVWTMFCGESAALPEQFINSTLKGLDCTEKQHEPHTPIATLLLFWLCGCTKKCVG